MNRFRLFCLFSALMCFIVGCGPELSKQDLGTVVDEVPKMEGAGEPYPMPQLGPPSEDEQAPDRQPRGGD